MNCTVQYCGISARSVAECTTWRNLWNFAVRFPHCPGCGGVVKPDVVLYEEMLDRNTIEDAIDKISHADMLIIGGTSLVVYPAAGYVDYFQGDSLVMINRDETPRDSRCSLVFRESVGKVLESGVAALKE